MFAFMNSLRSLLVMTSLVVMIPFATAGSAGTQSADYDPPQPLVEEKINELLRRLSSNAEQIKQDQSLAYKLSNELVIPHIDFPRITRLIIGKYWRAASDEQRRHLIDEISSLLIRSYVTAMSAYADDTLTEEQVVYLPSRYQAGDTRSTVRAKISLDSGQNIGVQYALYRTNGVWKIYDIRIEGISLALTYRASFGDTIKNQGLDALIAQLEESNKKGEVDLPGTVTETFGFEEFTAENGKDNKQ